MAKTVVEEIQEIQARWHTSEVHRGEFNKIVIALAERIDKLEEKQKINIL